MRTSRVRGSVVGAIALVAAITVATLPAVSAEAARAGKPKPPVARNLIRDPGAEAAKPDSDGGKVAVPAWTPAKGSEFTAVAYGASGGFPTASSPGPAKRGHAFFAGGPSGATSGATQVDKLTADATLIRSGDAHFVLSGWLGGYADQRDHATLTVVWETTGGTALGHTTIGPVTPKQRKDVTGLLFRSASGTVPATATRALVELHMVREDGEYIDGYADSLRLAITAKS